MLARERGALAPARQVSSAKSWLAHPAVDRRAAILPWGARTPTAAHLARRCVGALPDAHPRRVERDDRGRRRGLRLERQTIVLTVPASFDEEARELTVEAARSAGLANLTLLEEPIAAFYAWMAEHAWPIGRSKTARSRSSATSAAARPTSA